MCPVQDIDVLSEETVGLHRRSFVTALITAGSVVLIDQITKIWADRNLVAGPCRAGGDECVDLIFGLRLHLVYNRGAAFSTGTDLGPVFGVVALVMTVVLLTVAARRVDRWSPILLGLITGGAAGNVIDRIFRAEDGLLSGAVIDFIDVQWWPVFNIADSAVVVGVILYVAYSLLEPEHAQQRSVDAEGAQLGGVDSEDAELGGADSEGAEPGA